MNRGAFARADARNPNALEHMSTSTISSRLQRWLDRRGGGVGLQWVGERLAIARVDHADAPRITRLATFDATAAQRAAVVRALAKEGVFRNAHVRLLLAPGQYDLHFVAAPAVPAAEMREALRWQLRGALACPPEEALVDFVPLPAPDAGSTNRNALLAVSAQRAVVLEAVAPLLANGIEIGAVDVPEFAQHQIALRSGRTHRTRSTAWLALDEDTCLITVHPGASIAFARRMLLPSLAREEANPLAHFCERVATQVQRSIELYERQSGLPAVDRLVLGPHHHAAELARVLRESTAITVESFSASSLPRIDIEDDAAQFSALTLPSLGAALTVPEDAATWRRAA